MLNHTTHLISKIDPLKYLLSKASLTGRVAKWVLILSKFNIVYKDRKAIKGQVIADQLAKASLTSQDAKLVLILSEFNIVYKDCQAIKGQVIVDQLVEAPLQGDHPIIANFLDDIIMIVTPST